MKKIVSLLLVSLLTFSLVACGSSSAPAPAPAPAPAAATEAAPAPAPASDVVVKVGSKDFTEQLILGQIAIQALEANGIKTQNKTNVAGSDTCRKALESKEFDMYWEYTGTAFLMLHANDNSASTSDEVYNAVKTTDAASGLTWLDYAPLNNTYALAMKKEKADELGIKTYSDLSKYLKENPNSLVLCCDHEFTARPDGLAGLTEAYGMDFGNSLNILDMGLVFQTMANNQADVGMLFATDGRIKANNLFVLQDDKNFFPVYNPAPVIRTDTLEKVPQIADILKPISALLTDDVMQELNLRVDGDEAMEPAEVADEWLSANGFK